MKISALLLLTVYLCWIPLCVFSAPTYGEYTNSVSLGSQVTVKYKIVGTEAFFLIEKTTAGFVAFGIGSGMSSADIVTITKNPSTFALSLEDCSLAGQTDPICSESAQDWTFASGTAAGSSESTATSLKVEIKRNLAASGTNNDKAIINGSNTFIYSYTTSNSLVKHDNTGARGTVTIDFTAGSSTPNTNTGNTNNGSSNNTTAKQAILFAGITMLVYKINFFL